MYSSRFSIKLRSVCEINQEGIKYCLSLCILVGAMGVFSACKPEDEEDKFYDFTIKIASDDGEEWVFSPDVTELHTTRECDGKGIVIL
mgnify:CR=1 FL=1